MTIVGLISISLLLPESILAHHPGVSGPLTHLGIKQVVVVFGASLVDAFNPTAFGVLLLIIHQTTRRVSMIRTGLLYLLGIFVVYVSAGIVLRESYVHGGPTFLLQSIQLVLACMLLYTGVSELLRAISPIRLPGFESVGNRLMPWLERGLVFPVGIGVGIVELFSTGAIYFAFIQALSFDPNATPEVYTALMAVYLAGFLLPLVAALFFIQQAVPVLTQVLRGERKKTAVIIGVILIVAAGWVGGNAIDGLRLLL